MSAALNYANNNDYYVHIIGLHSGIEVKFKAMLSSFSDNLTTNYNSEEVYGRIDPIMTYQGTSRKLSMKLEVPAADIDQAENNFQSLSRLMASQYPGYVQRGSATTLSTAPMHKIKFANWITSAGAVGRVQTNGLVVMLEGVSFAPNLDAGVIETATKILPKQFDLELNMTVLHTEKIGWDVGGWTGAQNYPYTEKTEDVSLNNPPEGEPLMSIQPVDGDEGPQMSMEEPYQTAIRESMLDQQLPSEAGYTDGPELSGPGYTNIDYPMSGG